jgi:hypothetical protein
VVTTYLKKENAGFYCPLCDLNEIAPSKKMYDRSRNDTPITSIMYACLGL